MLSPDVLKRRRERLSALLPDALVVLGGHRQQSLNIPMNLTTARQSSHMLFLTGLREAESALLFRTDTGRLELFLPEKEPGDEVWHGPTPSNEEVAAAHGADAAWPLSALEARVAWHREHGAGALQTLPSADPGWTGRMRRLELEVPQFGGLDRYAASPLADALVTLRLSQDEAGLAEMRRAAALTVTAHRAAMAATRPGRYEAQIRALIEGIFTSSGMRPSYDPIVTVRGEVLHCRSNPHRLGEDDLLLVDAGAESENGYAADVTRTWPVRGTFDARQKAIYEIVLEAQLQCIDRVRPGREYLEIHLHAARVIAEGLRGVGLLRGSIDELVENDAHAIFFPHGIGHLIGLDVHDIEDLGDRAGYGADRKRSSRFGLGYLRLNRTLQPGMAVTIEPGIYFIPGLLNNAEIAEKYGRWIDLDLARNYLGFGGIRIEDDVVTTEGAPEVLTGALPKRVAEVEALVGSALEGLGVLDACQPGRV